MKEHNNIIYGKHSVLELLKESPFIFEKIYAFGSKESYNDLIELAEKKDIMFQIFTRKCDFDIFVKKHCLSKVNHQNLIAFIKEYQYHDIEKHLKNEENSRSIVLVLSNITDVSNFGAIIRSAVAFGVDFIVIPKDRSVGVNATVYKTSSGLVAKAKIARVVNISRSLELMKKAGYWVYAADSNAPDSLKSIKFSDKIVLVLGAEGSGIPQGVLKHVDAIFRIPIQEQVESLNVSVAAGISLYHISQMGETG